MIDRKKIIKRREERNMTQEQFAEAIHTSRQMVSLIELGYRQPSVELLQYIAAYFDCTLDDLVIPPQREDTA